MLYTIISNIPFFEKNENTVLHNRLVLIIGTVIYTVVGVLLYFNKIPIFSDENFKKYLKFFIIFVLLDFISFFYIHKQRTGYYPSITKMSLDGQMDEKSEKSEKTEKQEKNGKQTKSMHLNNQVRENKMQNKKNNMPLELSSTIDLATGKESNVIDIKNMQVNKAPQPNPSPSVSNLLPPSISQKLQTPTSTQSDEKDKDKDKDKETSEDATSGETKEFMVDEESVSNFQDDISTSLKVAMKEKELSKDYFGQQDDAKVENWDNEDFSYDE